MVQSVATDHIRSEAVGVLRDGGEPPAGLSVVPRDWQVGVEGAFSVVTHIQNVIIIACKGRDLVVFNTGREGTTTPTPNSR